MDQRVCQWHKWGLGVGEGAPHTLQSYRPWLRTTKFDCRSERLNIQTDNVQTTYCNGTQTHNLCSNQPRDSNRKVCSNRPTTVRTWPLTASFFNLCFLRLRTNGRRPDTLPQPITERLVESPPPAPTASNQGTPEALPSLPTCAFSHLCLARRPNQGK